MCSHLSCVVSSLFLCCFVNADLDRELGDVREALGKAHSLLEAKADEIDMRGE